MAEKKHDQDEQGKSTFFSLGEGSAAAFIGILTAAVSFVPFVSYFSFVIPLAAVLIERKSGFVRVCGMQYCFASVLTAAASGITLLITPFAESAMNSAEMGRTFGFGTLGILMSVIRIACLAAMILTAYNAMKNKLFDIPYVTVLIKKMIKYSKD